MVSEATIIGMFLDSHNLYAVVAFLGDTWKNLFLKFLIATDLFLLLRHTDMAFIYQQRICRRLENPLLHFIGFLRNPNLGTEYFSLFVLYDTCSPCRNALTATAVPMYHQLVQVTVFHSISRKLDFPIAVCLAFQAVFLFFLPTVKSSDYKDLGCVRRPFAENPAVVSTMQTEIEVSGCEIR